MKQPLMRHVGEILSHYFCSGNYYCERTVEQPDGRQLTVALGSLTRSDVHTAPNPTQLNSTELTWSF